MATEIDDQLTTYFRWLDTQTGLSLHREDQAIGARTVPLESVPEITALELQFRDQPTRPRRQRLIVVAAIVGTLVVGAVTVTALYRPGGRRINTNTTVVRTEVPTSTQAIDSTTPATIEPTTTTVPPGPPSTPAAGATGRPGALLGGNVESTAPLYFVSDDPAWRLTEVRAGSAPQRTDAYPQIILLGEGDIATRAQATINVGVSTQLPPELADSGGVAVRVGDEEGRGRSTTVDERVPPRSSGRHPTDTSLGSSPRDSTLPPPSRSPSASRSMASPRRSILRLDSERSCPAPQRIRCW